ncbi:putative inorganic phosphate cotransporter [Halotydeus destructor]|nr:putative inorganic phosphate cotransporter [Halotydeus destructor]
MVATTMPAYMSDILHVQPTKNGLINGLLYLTACSSLATAGGISEKIIISGWMSRTAVRKLFCFISLTIPGICILAVPWLGCGTLLPSILLIMGNFFDGFATGGQIPLATELTTHFVATLVAISNTLCHSAGFLTPYVVGLVLQSSSDVLTSWRIVFGTTFIFLFSGSLVFVFFADATVQPWDDVEDSNNNSRKTKQLAGNELEREKISIRI